MSRAPLAALVLTLLASPALSADLDDPELVRVNGTPIRRSELVDRLVKRYGGQTMDEMVDELLLRQAAASRKIAAPQAEVERRLGRLRSQFGSPELFASQLEQAGTSVEKLRADLAEEIVRERLVVSARDLKVTEDELQKAFARGKDKLGTPPAVRLRHILVKTEAEAKDVVAKVKAGEDFSKLARERSLAASGKAAGGDYGFVSRGMLPPEIEEVAFSLKEKEIRALPGPRGHHVLQSLGSRPGKPAEYEEVKDDLRELLMAEKIKQAAPGFLAELRRTANITSPGAPPPAKP